MWCSATENIFQLLHKYSLHQMLTGKENVQGIVSSHTLFKILKTFIQHLQEKDDVQNYNEFTNITGNYFKEVPISDIYIMNLLLVSDYLSVQLSSFPYTGLIACRFPSFYAEEYIVSATYWQIQNNGFISLWDWKTADRAFIQNKLIYI